MLRSASLPTDTSLLTPSEVDQQLSMTGGLGRGRHVKANTPQSGPVWWLNGRRSRVPWRLGYDFMRRGVELAPEESTANRGRCFLTKIPITGPPQFHIQLRAF